VTVGLLPACQVDDLDLAGKTCPCASGWTCEPSTNTCVQGLVEDGGVDAEVDAGSDADASDAGCEGGSLLAAGLEGPRGWPSCTNGVDDDCDGFTDEEDADCGYVFSVVRASSPPTIDGDCAEYASAQSLSLRTDAENVMVYWLMWDQTALYCCVDVKDSSLDAEFTDPSADRDLEIWRDDALEMFLDVDHDGGALRQLGDYKFFVNVFNVQTDSEALERTWSTDYDSAVQVDGTPNVDGDTDRGFRAELAVSWASWGIAAPTAQTVWGGDLAWNDRDTVDGSARNQTVWANILGGDVNTPDGFGDLLFVE
jgi:hypothetical protein